MRKVIAGYASSLDGYITGPNGEYDWILINKEIDFEAQMKQYDVYFYGRKTYEAVKTMGKPFRSARHFVFSHTLREVEKGFILIDENVEEQVISIKKQDGKPIALFGGASLLTSLLHMQLVDEIHVSIIPVLLGNGKPMVDPLNKNKRLNLLDTRTFSNGTVQLKYSVQYGS